MLVKIGIELSSVIVGGLILIVFSCILYAIVQQMWQSMWILIAMEAVLIVVTVGSGILDVLLEEAYGTLIPSDRKAARFAVSRSGRPTASKSCVNRAESSTI